MDAKSWIQEIRAAGKLMAAGDLAGAENRYRQLLDKGTDNPLHKALALDGLGVPSSSRAVRPKPSKPSRRP